MESLLTQGSRAASLDDAYAYCEALARGHYENFTVVSWLLPRRLHPHFHAIYAFCRFVDDLGDEAAGDRLILLDQWEQDLRRCYDGTPQHPILVALQHTIRTFDIPAEPFLRLIEANRMDQGSGRFPTYGDLLHYCEHSATPVGHMVLYVMGYRDLERQRLSDATCTALQLANFWQDVARDAAKGRIYIPLEDITRFGYSEAELLSGIVNDNFRRLMAFEVDRAWGLFRQGLPLVNMVRGRARLDVALFSLGGMSILRAIERQHYDVFARRPTLSGAAKVRLMVTAALRLALGRSLA